MWLTQCPLEIYAVVYAGPEEHSEQPVVDLTVLRSVSAQHPCAGTHKECTAACTLHPVLQDPKSWRGDWHFPGVIEFFPTMELQH